MPTQLSHDRKNKGGTRTGKRNCTKSQAARRERIAKMRKHRAEVLARRKALLAQQPAFA